MSTPLNVLFIEDSEDDVLLMLDQLRRGGYALQYERVDAPGTTAAALRDKKWDVVICDHAMPRFSMPEALTMVKALNLDTPFIIVSGSIGEEVAVSAMKAGAHDYIMKDKMARLAPAIERELREAEVRRKRREAEAESARLMEAEKKARQAAEKASRIKDEFLATVSHELRTPLTSILGWAHLLSSGRLSPEDAKRAIVTIERNARAQAHLIEDLLDVSRIISGKLRIRIGKVNLLSVVKAAIDIVRPMASLKNIQLMARLDPVPVLEGDADRLQQVAWNLLSNAVRYTENAGRVEVRLEQAGDSARMTVADNGIGISSEFLPHMFERFQQADMSSTRTHGGLGIGLAIVHYLVEMHGGSVSVHSEGIGKGATFTVTVPIARPGPAAGADAAPAAAAPSATALQDIAVLLVEDDEDSRELLAQALRQFGAKVTATGSARAALDVIDQVKPDVLVSDIAMPDEDGYSLMRKIRARTDEFSHLPAVAVSALARTEDKERALAAGYQVHVSKPVNPPVLISTVAGLLVPQQ